MSCVVRGDCDHNQRGPQDDEHRPQNQDGHQDEAGHSQYPGGRRHGHR